MQQRLLLALSIGLAAGALTSHPHRPTLAAPVPRPRPEPDVAELSRRARSKDEATRERAVGLLFKHLKPGMTRKQVEALIGSPDRPINEGVFADGEEAATYYARLPGKHGTQLMTVEYDSRRQPWKLVKVSGPHFPDD
jgi:hypothetical protein